MLSVGLAVAFGAMLSFTVSDFLAKRVSERWGSKRTTLLMLASSLATMLACAYFLGLSGINYVVVLFSMLSGVVYALAGLLLYKAFETEQVSNTVSLAGIEYALIIILSIALLSETVTAVEIASFVVIFAGAFLATTAKRFEFDMGYIPAVFAMIAYAIAYMLLVFARQSSGGLFTPLIINRIMAVVVMAMYLRVSSENGKRFGKIRLGSVGYRTLAANTLLGVFNGFATILLLLLSQLNFVAVGSAIVAAEPALIIFLGYLIYKERFEKHQIVGLVMLAIGTVVLSVA